nr:MAG TPA: hypothetical protein [Caudoviricetes sp.]
MARLARSRAGFFIPSTSIIIVPKESRDHPEG